MNLLLLAFMYGLHVSYCKCSGFKRDQNSDLNTFGRIKINELLIVSIVEDHILLMFMEKKKGPGKQVWIIKKSR